MWDRTQSFGPETLTMPHVVRDMLWDVRYIGCTVVRYIMYRNFYPLQRTGAVIKGYNSLSREDPSTNAYCQRNAALSLTWPKLFK